ncbi:MAG TPA: hypothetical protein VHP63_04925 [candidate division Zixibacteria bacterium]|nr:hypothetical protein [candidate division Zixibacteria bacterium]
MNHLTDLIIQEYLDSGEKKFRIEVEDHAVYCPECQEKLEQYRELYTGAAIESEPVLDSSFNLSVLAGIEQLEHKKNIKVLATAAAVVGALSMTIITLIYFNLLSWTKAFVGAGSMFSDAVSPVFHMMSALAKELNGNLEILAFAGLVLMLFHLLDRSLVKQKVNRI